MDKSRHFKFPFFISKDTVAKGSLLDCSSGRHVEQKLSKTVIYLVIYSAIATKVLIAYEKSLNWEKTI